MSDPKDSITILAVAQATSKPTLAETLDALASITHDAAKQNVNLLLFPEAYLGGYPRGSSFDAVVGSRTSASRKEFLAYARSAVDLGDVSHDGAGGVYTNPGDGTRERLEEIARKEGVFLAVGCIERVGGTLYCGVLYVRLPLYRFIWFDTNAGNRSHPPSASSESAAN